MRSVLIDVRLAVRAFGLRLWFTAVSALTLALGIGVTTAIFSAVLMSYNS